MLRLAICDDDPIFIEQFRTMVLEHLAKIYITHTIDLFMDAPSFLKSDLAKYDIVFLDVKIADHNGLDVAWELKKRNPKVILIFISAYIDYAPQGYEVKAFRYLIKKGADELKDALNPCLQDTLELIEQRDKSIRIKTTDGQSKSLLLSEIWYIESQNHNVIYHTAGAAYVTYDALCNVMAQINSPDYLQVQRSFIVNLRHAVNVYGDTIEFPGGQKAIVNRKNREAVMARFLAIQGEC